MMMIIKLHISRIDGNFVRNEILAKGFKTKYLHQFICLRLVNHSVHTCYPRCNQHLQCFHKVDFVSKICENIL